MIKKIVTAINDRLTGKAPSGAKRSSKWPALRKSFIKKNPKCAVCGGRKNVEVHHKKPFHSHPELELDETNLISLCEGSGMNCHLTFGHLGSYQSFNPTIDKDAKSWAKKLKSRPK
jgi:5-methylcytosine-specific restriction enzyme A